MKFSNYLKSIRSGTIYSEISVSSIATISDPTQKIQMTRLDKGEEEAITNGIHYLVSHFKADRAYNNFEELFKDSRENIDAKAKELHGNDSEVMEKIKQAINTLDKLKGNVYYYLGYDGRYVFRAGPKLYFVKLVDQLLRVNGKQKQQIDISFDEIVNDYPNGNYMAGNSIFNKKLYGDTGSVLFKKVAGIIKNEFKNWQNIIFGFEAKKEDAEYDVEKKVIDTLDLLRTLIGDHLAGRSIKEEDIDEIKGLKVKTKNLVSDLIKKRAKELLDDGTLFKEALSALVNQKRSATSNYNPDGDELKEEANKRAELAFNEANSFIDLILSNKPIKKLDSPLLVPSGIFIVRDNDVKEISTKGSMRQKLYLNIINQMFGKVYTLQRRGDLYFSKSKTLEKTNEII